MKKIILILLVVLFSACNEKVETTQNESVVDKEEQSLETYSKNSMEPIPNANDILHKLGLDMNGEKISIDMNKTTEFIQRMEIEMHGKADEIERKIEQADFNFTKDFGIELEGERVAIDLNKTRDMLRQLNILMKDILLDVNHTVH